jgi:hypothetical protein
LLVIGLLQKKGIVGRVIDVIVILVCVEALRPLFKNFGPFLRAVRSLW